MNFALVIRALQFEQWGGPELNEYHHNHGYPQTSGCVVK